MRRTGTQYTPVLQGSSQHQKGLTALQVTSPFIPFLSSFLPPFLPTTPHSSTESSPSSFPISCHCPHFSSWPFPMSTAPSLPKTPNLLERELTKSTKTLRGHRAVSRMTHPTALIYPQISDCRGTQIPGEEVLPKCSVSLKPVSSSAFLGAQEQRRVVSG